MMAHPLPPITHFHSNSEVTHMLLARHSLSLDFANSQRDFFTNCTSIWEFEFFSNNLLGAVMTSFHLFHQDSYIAQCQIHLPLLISKAHLQSLFNPTMTWMNKNL
jgi:hypothetical protein